MALGSQRSGSPLASYLRIPRLMTGSPLTHLKKESPPVNTYTHTHTTFSTVLILTMMHKKYYYVLGKECSMKIKIEILKEKSNTGGSTDYLGSRRELKKETQIFSDIIIS